MTRPSAALLLASLLPFPLFALGCEQVQDIKDTVDGLTNPMVVEGVLLGVEPPDVGSGLDLTNSDFARGTSVKAYLADAGDPTQLADAPVKGAMVHFVSDSNGGQVLLQDQQDGSYSANEEDDGLEYVAEQVALTAELGGELRKISVNAPPIANAPINNSHAAGNPMNVDISDQSFDGLLVVVLSSSGEVAFSNLPETIEELYDFTHGEGELAVEIPGGAFNQPGLYAVGVAGTRNAGVDEMEEVNTALSTFVAGKFKFTAVNVD
ncbi:hypothetical protein L6R53_17625 [Myxococcota bacterium]|nr:hypothetical protein [Myxococcota bacterium]